MYPSDLSDKEWERIADFFKRSDPRGARSIYEKRAIVNAILYVLKGGIPWRMLPKDYPPWDTVYDHYRRWCKRGVWETVLTSVNGEWRLASGKQASPTYAIVDSQSVKTVYASKERGIDGGKKSKAGNGIL
jgi:putative transposase